MWETKTKLLQHQVNAVAKLKPLKVGALFMEMGTGKTRTAIELAKLRLNKIDRVIWFCPVSVKETIKNEILKHTTLNKNDIFVFDHKTDSTTDGLKDYPFVVVGIESFSSSARVIFATQQIVDERTMVVLDESTYIKNSRAKRSRRITLLSSVARYRMILTGTAMSQGVVDLYSQMNFLSPKILDYVSFAAFAEAHLIYRQEKDQFGNWKYTKHIIGEQNTEILAKKIALYSYQVKKSECVDLPEKIYTSFSFDLTEQQMEAASEAKNIFIERMMEKRFDVNSNSIAIFKLFSDLQSISCGFWGKLTFKHNRINTMMEAIDRIEDEEKVVIWAKYHHCIKEITTALAKEYGERSVYQYHGRIREKQRTNNLIDWQKNGRFLVATQSAGGHGLNELVGSSHVIFYANSFKYSERLQAEDRTHRIGQTSSCWYADITATSGVDLKIKENLEAKGDTLKIFIDNLNKYKQLGMKEEIVKMIMDI